MFHPTVDIQCLFCWNVCWILKNPSWTIVDHETDRKKTKAEQKRKRKNELPQHQTGKRQPHFFNESGLSRENKPLPRTQRPLQRDICVHFQENNILINKQQPTIRNTIYKTYLVHTPVPAKTNEQYPFRRDRERQCSQLYSRCKMFIPSVTLASRKDVRRKNRLGRAAADAHTHTPFPPWS